jgi:hypothetical protein
MRRAFALVVGFVATTLPARADEYYVTIFTAESVPYRPTNTHAFASIVRVPTSANGKFGVPEGDAICWGPANKKVRGITLAPEAGANMTLTETLDWCFESGWRVSVWGPYRTEYELYQKLKAQSVHLSSGFVKYKPTDNFLPRSVAVNCYHALTQPVSRRHWYSGAFTAGDAGGTTVLQAYRPWLIDPCTTHDHILSVIGADKYELTRRSFDYQPGRIDAIRSAAGR